jgi:hypothetical protein
MTAAILCPGPSLAHASAFEGELRIGVNRAVTAHKCDVWACCDYQCFFKVRDEVIGWPILLTNAESAKRVRWTEVITFESLQLKPETFSAIAAVWYAVDKGAKVINVYGCDLEGEADWDGVKAGETRTKVRWEHERAVWASTWGCLKTQGISLEVQK